jgi:hypothetical protein
MDFDTEKLLAKVSGKNVENFSDCIISDATKAQVDFAFNQMFSGLSLLQWMRGGTLRDSWNSALDKIRDFIFSLEDRNYLTDYLYHAVFDFRKNIIKTVFPSVHANEYCNCPIQKQTELEVDAEQKVKQGIDIIRSLLSDPKKCCANEQKNILKVYTNQKTQERENNHERER